SNNKIDKTACCKLMIAAGGRPVTFHRAFDLTEDDRALNDVITLGFKTILTSGRCKTASEGISTIKNLIDRAGSEISIMPGSGINPLNIKRIAEETGAEEFHSSGQDPERRPVIVEDFVVKGTTSYPLSDELSVKKMRKILDELQFQDKAKYY
ncbi:copper homeostasis protein cutC, partial [Trichonephila clavata]